MDRLQKYTNRYQAAPAASNGPGQPNKPEDSVPEFIAYLYTAVRHDEAMLRLLDCALKKRYLHAKDDTHRQPAPIASLRV